MSDPLTTELLALNQRLLDSIASADWDAYQELTDPSLTAFEPEALGQLVEGLPFHEFYFQRSVAPGATRTTMASPHVRVLGDAAVVAYVRLIQKRNSAGNWETVGSEETRVWHRRDGRWRQVHFHRAPLGSSRPIQ